MFKNKYIYVIQVLLHTRKKIQNKNRNDEKLEDEIRNIL